MRLLQAEIEADPEADLQVKLRTISQRLDPPPKSSKPPPTKMDFCERLVFGVKNAEIIYPLSEAGTSLLASYTKTGTGPLDGSSLVDALKRMISTSEKLWENSLKGVILKCNEEIKAKIIRGNEDYTEYTSIQFLALKCPYYPSAQTPWTYQILKRSYNAYELFPLNHLGGCMAEYHY